MKRASANPTISVLKSSYLRTKAVWYLCRFLGQPIPYKYGGDDAIEGFDCSGLMMEVLQGVGYYPHKADKTAHGLYLEFKDKKPPNQILYAGCLVFWFKEGRARHVAMAIDDYHIVGAAGGGEETTTPELAAKHDAWIYMRPVGYRGDNYKICDPFMIKET